MRDTLPISPGCGEDVRRAPAPVEEQPSLRRRCVAVPPWTEFPAAATDDEIQRYPV